MGVQIKSGNNSTGLANVSATYEIQAVTPQIEENAGFVQVSSEVDAGLVLGSRTVLPMEISDDYRVRAGLDQTLFNMSFEGTVVATHLISQILSVMTTNQQSGYFSINNGNATTSGNHAIFQTRRGFPLYGTYPTYIDLWIREANFDATNAISEWGIGYVTTVNAPTDGVFFRRNSAGVLKAVVNYAGTETEETIDTTNVPSRSGVGAYDATECNHYLVVIHNDIANFWINDVLVASISCPDAQPSLTSSSSQPVFARVYNSGTASAGRRVEIGFLNVSLGDQHNNKPWQHALCGLGQGAYQTQLGTATAQTANWANSAAPASASLSNTAASYATLGGQYQFAATATNETDWALFGYLNPVGTNALPGKTLYVTNIRVSKMLVTGAAAVNATMFFWAVGIGSSAVSLATTDTAVTISPKRIPLGIQNHLASAAVGTAADGFDVSFADAPLVVYPGAYFHIILKQLNGTNTASLVFRGQVMVNGYFE
jgi:hypothetical protein